MDACRVDDGREHDSRAARLASALAESGVGSTLAIEALMARLYRNDAEGLGHLYRVAELARNIAGELGMSPAEVQALEHAALLHDIGRFVVPDPSALAASRRDRPTLRRRAEQMRAACAIIADIPFLAPASAILAASVECFDGSGFPEGRRGEDIPLSARVLHLADTIDTLTLICDAMAAPADAAGTEIVREAGSRFDPDVVSAWLRSRTDLTPQLVSWWAAPARWN